MKKVPKDLVIAILLASMLVGLVIVRHLSVITDTWTSYLFLVGGLALGLSLTTIDRKFLRAYYDPDRKDALVTQSILFIGACIPLSFLVITSSASYAGGGLVVGIALTTLVTMWRYRSNDQLFDSTFMSQLKRPLVSWERQVLLAGVLIWNVLLWIAMLR
jgi:hypothetical protein